MAVRPVCCAAGSQVTVAKLCPHGLVGGRKRPTDESFDSRRAGGRMWYAEWRKDGVRHRTESLRTSITSGRSACFGSCR